MENYYDNLCTEMYEILHATPPQDELNFYLTYAKAGMKMFEPLCGNGKFMIPFIEKGFDIYGNDLSQSMLDKLLKKCPTAKVECCNIENFKTNQKFDYIFIPSGSVGLFTNLNSLKNIFKNFYNILNKNGKFVFAVDTTNFKTPDHDDYKIVQDVNFQGKRMILELKTFYDTKTHTLYQPQVYKLFDNEKLLQSEEMDFQIHLYDIGEMDKILNEVGFLKTKVYTDYNKNCNFNDKTEFLIYECEK